MACASMVSPWLSGIPVLLFCVLLQKGAIWKVNLKQTSIERANWRNKMTADDEVTPQ